MPLPDLRADTQDELDDFACSQCGQHALSMTNTRYSDPICFTAVCANCGHREEGEGHPPMVLSLIEHLRLRPKMYGLTVEQMEKFLTTTPEESFEADPDGVWNRLKSFVAEVTNV